MRNEGGSSRTVLLIDSDTSRRHLLGAGLAEIGYEVVQTTALEEGSRYARALDVRLLVVHESAMSGKDASQALGVLPDVRVLLLGESDALDEESIDENVRLLGLAKLSGAALVDVVRLVLLGIDLGLEAADDLTSLVGDLNHHPLALFLEELATRGFSGRLDLPAGSLSLWQGRLVDARSGSFSGSKALGRVLAVPEGTFLLTPGGRTESPSLDGAVAVLVAGALEDRLGARLRNGTRLEVRLGRGILDASLDDTQRRILAACENTTSIEQLLDALPEPDGRLTEEILGLVDEGLLSARDARGAVVVTDSTADLPRELALRHGIEVVPLSVVLDGRVFQDGLDLDTARFYKLLPDLRDHPSTSPPTKRVFESRYRSLLDEGQAPDLLSLHLSSRLSETFSHSSAAARSAGDGNVEALDSRQVSLPLGLMALLASRMAARGVGGAELVGRTRAFGGRMRSLFVVDTLDFLVKGGRIGRAQGFVGKLFGIKPILSILDGEIVGVERVRGGRTAQRRIVELFREEPGTRLPVCVGIVHAAAPVWAERLRALLDEFFDIRETLVSEIGPVVGTHTGPGTVGAVLLPIEPGEEDLFGSEAL